MKPLKELLKHSSIYMLGQILTRMASVLLLPLYTHQLLPADYGVLAILDLITAILSTFIASGMVSAVTRYHFDQEDERHHDRVWWTGMCMVAGLCTVICIPAWMSGHVMANVTLGSDVANGRWMYTLAITTLWFSVIGQIAEAYLRVLKWSGTFVAISMGRLLLNVVLNVWLLVGLKRGVEGVLTGNLVATIIHTAVLMVVFLKTRGRFAIDPELGKRMLRFAAPLVVTAIASMLMHEADRYFLRIWQSMEQVGIYSLAHKIGFAVITLCLLPFSSIWHVAIYDFERLPNSQQLFQQMFSWFSAGLGILLLGAALCIHPVLPLLTPDSYGDSADLISVILLGLFMHGMVLMFEVPALLSKRTRLMVPGSVVGLVVNVVANMLLIPVLGAWGAAWAGVLTYAAFSMTVLFSCRTVMKIAYPWTRFLITVTLLCGTYLVLRYLCFPLMSPWPQLALSVVSCVVLTGILYGREGLSLLLDRLQIIYQKKSVGVQKSPQTLETPRVR